MQLARFGLRTGEPFTYEYDFFAGWRLDIRVEKIASRVPGRRYPICTGGARNALSEHCEGPEAFLALRQRWPPVLIAARMAEVLTDVLEAHDDRVRAEHLRDHREEMTTLVELSRLDDFDRAALNHALHALTPASISVFEEEQP